MRAPGRTAVPVIRFVLDTRVHQKMRSQSDSFGKNNAPFNCFATSQTTNSQATFLEEESSTGIMYNIPNTWNPVSMTSHGEATPQVTSRLLGLATSRPTHFTYESDLGSPEQTSILSDDKGVEAIFGCPNVIAVLLARTTSLRHVRVSAEEKAQRGMDLEKLIRDWQFDLARAKRSCMRVARVAVQEIWRHAAILYVHHAIFKSHPNNLTVQGSVKNIIKISSTIPPGGNLDCFLQPTYFIAGAFATFQRERYALKGRILGSGNERYLRDLAIVLEEIWEETDKTGRLSSWSKKPQSFVL
ncbi:fungal-specific transcription factor domain-containing protein [Rhizoctonia solani]|nr:fungal-specific transcription factor domain-containing protein [Rhizoctonia solani]